MRRIIHYLTLLLLLFAASTVMAQDVTVSGKVSSPAGDPLPGVNIVVKGTTTGTTTDVDGKYKLTIPQGSTTLVFTFVGYQPQNVNIDGRSVVDVTLQESSQELEEVVITGLATSVKRSNLANAVSSISAQELVGTTRPVTTDGALYGKLPGATITQNSSAPGGGFSIQLRGLSTLGASASQPLFIVDGVYIDNSTIANGRSNANGAVAGSSNDNRQDNNSNRIADLNPADIESIEVLKGSSAAAIYGTRANAGVIIITTKKGKEGKTRISFGQDIGYNEAWRYMPTEAWSESKIKTYYDGDNDRIDQELALFRAAQQSGKIYDYQKEVYGNKGALRNTRLSVSGGNEKTSFYVSGGMTQEDGIVKNTGFDRYSVRANVDHKVSKFLQIGVSSNYIHSNTDRGWAGNDNSYINYAYAIPYTPSYANLFPDEKGIFPDNPYAGENPLATAARAINNQKVNRFIQGFNATFNLFSNETTTLKFKANGGLDYQSSIGLIYLPPDMQSQRATANPGFIRDTRTEVFNGNMQGFLVFDKAVLDNKLFLTTQLGAVRLVTQNKSSFTQATRTAANQQNPINGVVPSLGADYSSWQDVGLVAQQEANYQDKLIATLGIRFDKSSLNGDYKKYYPFPKASLAMNLNKFSFWEPLSNKVNQLKLRAAYGETGGVPNFGIVFTTLPLVVVDGLPGGVVGGSGTAPLLGNTQIKPERATEFELGVDFGLFDNKVTGEITYYNKVVYDLIQPQILAPSVGYSQKQFNAADMRNRGWEVSLSTTPIKTSNFSWTFQPMFWLNRNKVTRLDIPTRLAGGFGAKYGQWRVKQGESATTIVAQNAEGQLVAYGDQFPKFQMSFMNTLTIAKNFDLSFLFHWKKGGYNASLTKLLFDEGGSSEGWSEDKNNNGTPDGIDHQGSGNFVFDASYVRLREVALYYRVPAAFITKTFAGKVQNVKVGVSGNNVLTWTKYKAGYDPEASNFGSQALGGAVDIGSIPATRRLFFHLSVDF